MNGQYFLEPNKGFLYWLFPSTEHFSIPGEPPPMNPNPRELQEGDMVTNQKLIVEWGGLKQNCVVVKAAVEPTFTKKSFPDYPTYDSIMSTFKGEWKNNQIFLKDGYVLVQFPKDKIVKLRKNWADVIWWTGLGVEFVWDLKLLKPQVIVETYKKYLGKLFDFSIKDYTWGHTHEGKWYPLMYGVQYIIEDKELLIPSTFEEMITSQDKERYLYLDYLNNLTPDDIIKSAQGAQVLEVIPTYCPSCLNHEGFHLKSHVIRNEITFYLIYSVLECSHQNAIVAIWDLIDDCKRRGRNSVLFQDFIDDYRAFLFGQNRTFLMDVPVLNAAPLWQHKIHKEPYYTGELHSSPFSFSSSAHVHENPIATPEPAITFIDLPEPTGVADNG